MRKKGWCFLPPHGRPPKGYDYRIGRTALLALGEATGNVVHRVWTDGDVGETKHYLSAPSIITLYQYDATRILQRFINLCGADLLLTTQKYREGCFEEQVKKLLGLREILGGLRPPGVHYALSRLEQELTELKRTPVVSTNYGRARTVRILLDTIKETQELFNVTKPVWITAYEASQVLPRNMTMRLANLITQNKPKPPQGVPEWA